MAAAACSTAGRNRTGRPQALLGQRTLRPTYLASARKRKPHAEQANDGFIVRHPGSKQAPGERLSRRHTVHTARIQGGNTTRQVPGSYRTAAAESRNRWERWTIWGWRGEIPEHQSSASCSRIARKTSSSAGNSLDSTGRSGTGTSSIRYAVPRR